jgi:prepilin-type N-terminal cleavage/methylation domain-containing protein
MLLFIPRQQGNTSLRFKKLIIKYKMLTPNTRRAGFTLVEIMIVVAIIALLAAIAVPNFMRARKRSQATMILDQLKTLDQAVDQYAIENNKSDDSPWYWPDVAPYIKNGTPLYNTSSAGQALDVLGNKIASYPTVGGDPKTVENNTRIFVPHETFQTLSDVAPSDFWSPFPIYPSTF